MQNGSPWLCLLVWPIAMLFAGRTMRGLECLVHEASHYNFTRKRRLNDALADGLCAWPVLSQVAKYRKSHMVHHRAFEHETDPDRIRFEKLGLTMLDRSDPWRLALGIARRLLPYIPGWWWAIGVDLATMLRFAVWHVALFLLPMGLLLGWGAGLTLWLLTWAAPVFFVLPVVRFIDDEAYRRRILVQLNRGEGRHQLARATFHGKRGELRQRYREGQEDQLGALGLVVNLVVLWNTIYMDAALDQLVAEGYDVRPEDVARLSPLGFRHVNMLGRYAFTLPDFVARGELRSLRDPQSADPDEP